ncbi:MAG TPA: DUF2585 family protein, partial [Gemmataceae bacterium]|nr:DUF2585 family protein [Gemmataceae bacterium]
IILPKAFPVRKMLPLLAILAVLAVTTLQLRIQGRRWWCACGQPNLWTGDPNGSHNSQHLFDPYSFTHVLHGVLFFWLLAWTCRRMPLAWRLWLTVGIESLWEVVENSAFVIERYRTATAAVGYEGDSVANSIGDILSCVLGFVIARVLGFWWSLALFFVTEAILLLWIKDDLLINVVMLIHPVSWIKEWQGR